VAVLTAPRNARVEIRTMPTIGPRQLRVRLEGCGVCGSNLPVWEGRPWFSYPFDDGAPGQEGWGRVDEIGSEVENVRPGDRVAALSYRAFADYDVADASSVVRLPPALDGRPFPGEALGCAMNVFRRSGIEAGQTVAIVGIGFMGALLVNLAVRRGARVIAISRRPFALELARRMGAQETIPLGETSRTAGAVREITKGAGCERVIEATGLQGPLDLASELTAERGRLAIAGYHQDGARQVNMQLWNWRGIDVINAHERDPAVYVEGMRAAVEAVARGELDPTPLYTDRFRLEEINTAFSRMHQRDGNFVKAILAYD
jgi:threonine dehydrogenase-like Zn-dependent dehydrogenase